MSWLQNAANGRELPANRSKIPSMKKFASDREALDYLSGRIAAEAARENVSLSEVERKMLYFSETDWTLPDMADVNAEFGRDYDEDEYERKIAGLVRNIEAPDRNDDREEAVKWNAAVEKLCEGDRYLLVLIDPRLTESKPAGSPPHDILKLWLTAFGIVFGLFALVALYQWLLWPRFSGLADRILGNQSGFGIFLVGLVILWFVGPRLWAALRMFMSQNHD